ncbi:tetratricopeptide repeat protein [Aeoliella mucimassa]|uniref:Anaphase-promoting complex, cyclosome, subunit 3 n=1 Tax=Aeoliella mucimassa TaxID=2527972 RepID=A0A518AKR3_9BACT|nr:tetratricopeptide repeat protein [Aeoliella mucimassa]QDU55328.1 Anaphase-promoting complex, cyclosome, subunit 3 [Aeoliella mucimassa]
MADETSTNANETKPAGLIGKLMGYVHGIRDWAAVSLLRQILLGAGFLGVLLATIGTWLYLAALTVSDSSPTIADALEAYDKGELQEARLLVVELTDSGEIDPADYGGPLFVLGAVKAAEAEQQWSSLQRQSQYLIASKYLQEAKSAGFPKTRIQEGNYLLGRSLLESGDATAGLRVLEEALQDDSADHTDLHLTLAAAYSLSDPPQFEAALKHIDTALESNDLQGEKRSKTLLDRIDTLCQLGRYNEARATLQAIPAELLTDNQIAMASAHTCIAELQRFLASRIDPNQEPTQLYAAVKDSITKLERISPAEDNAEEAMYLAGVAYGLNGETNRAIRQFERVRKLFSASPAGIAASVAEGDIYRQQKRDDNQALTAYRRCLSVLDSPRAYRNEYMPLHELRQRMMAAHADFLARDQYESAKTLGEQLGSLLGKTKQLELEADTYNQWGRYLVDEAARGVVDAKKVQREGRRKLREAGVDYEQYARRVFATPEYTEAVWKSAECYQLGQSYSSAIRMLNEYLKNEPVKRNALALLRLGQAHLSLGEVDEGVFALEECIELHPQDAAVFRARLDCAKAFGDHERIREAEQLLLSNLHSSGLTPESAEWRESLFELGHLLYDAERYDEAVDRLGEAVERKIGGNKSRLANYLIAESYRRAAEKPLQDLEQAKTANERESGTREVQHLLNKALHHYEQVRVDIANSVSTTPLDRAMLRNCYMFKGSALFALGRVEHSPERFKQAIDEYSNVSTLYQNEPFVLETFVQIANCWRRLNDPVKARLNVGQALELLQQLPEDADFSQTTNFNRSQWKLMLEQMLEW